MRFFYQIFSWYWILFCPDTNSYQSSVCNWIRIRTSIEFFKIRIRIRIHNTVYVCPLFLSVRPSDYLSICLSVYLIVHPSVCLSFRTVSRQGEVGWWGEQAGGGGGSLTGASRRVGGRYRCSLLLPLSSFYTEDWGWGNGGRLRPGGSTSTWVVEYWYHFFLGLIGSGADP